MNLPPSLTLFALSAIIPIVILCPLVQGEFASPAAFFGRFHIGLRVSILASGSSGNITLLESDTTRILVDAGLGKRETLARLAAVEREIDRSEEHTSELQSRFDL